MCVSHDVDYERTFEEFWNPIIMPDGDLNMDQLKRELHDYRTLIRNVSKVYDHVTGGYISKPMTNPDVVIREANRNYKLIWSEGES
jgi:hypothetical protein